MAHRNPHIAAEFHRAFRDALREQTTPAQVLATILANKVEAQGFDPRAQLSSLKKQATELLESSTADLESFVIQLETKGSGRKPVTIHLDASDIEKAFQSIDKIPETIFESMSEVALRSVLKDPKARILHRANEKDAFVRRLALTWATPFQLLDIHVSLCQELGEVRNDWLRGRRSPKNDLPVIDVVTRLHGRAVQVAEEAQTLLHHGFADGALSRWRTIHELTVTAMFISEKGNAAAERYIAHLDADSLKTARQYQRFAPTLGYQPISVEEQKKLDDLSRDLESRYGKPFLEDYGWAAVELGQSRPTFASIEAAVNLDRLRPYFRLASNTVHAGTKGTYYRLGMLGNKNIILAGASNAGLDEAGRLVALSLSQITVVLLLLRINTDSIVWSRVLLALSSKVEMHFIKVQRRIVREERRLSSPKGIDSRESKSTPRGKR